ncbi:DUF4365 domain-containing protein [Streptomyces sp. NPDC051684]|uniref:DUF4365 domain-containing protein n=1 Tax=Streptomyces sp. NPDC051684 TaxID=3365670 RepID=UPI00379EC445
MPLAGAGAGSQSGREHPRVDGVPQQVRPYGTVEPWELGDRNHQGDFGETFIRTLAVAADLDIAEKAHRDRRGVDWEITFPGRDGRYKQPRIVVQVKCWAPSEQALAADAPAWSYRLERHNLNLLAGRDWYDPRFLFLVVVPRDVEEWTRIDDGGMLLRYGAYWACFHDREPLEIEYKGQLDTVHVPKDQLLTIASLRELFDPAFRDQLGES